MKPGFDNGPKSRAERRNRAFPFKKARLAASLAFVALLVASCFLHTGTGTASAFGIGSIAAVCPLGQLEAALGSKVVSVHGIALLGLAVLIVLATGKAFCSWICPVPWIQKAVRPKRKRDEGRSDDDRAEIGRPCAEERLEPVGGSRDGLRLDTRHAVLIGGLASSAVFGFPVFCLVCPIGLAFATVIGVVRLFLHNETSWGLLLFPAVILVEVVFFRKWCHAICPVGALASLISTGNKTFKPRVERSLCLRESGIDCRSCVNACPEKLDPHSDRIPECTKCGDCTTACPAHAISIRLFENKRQA